MTVKQMTINDKTFKLKNESTIQIFMYLYGFVQSLITKAKIKS